jgi:hypothetical protein
MNHMCGGGARKNSPPETAREVGWGHQSMQRTTDTAVTRGHAQPGHHQLKPLVPRYHILSR